MSDGENHPATRLNPEKVKEIRRLANEGVSYREIARRFGVSNVTIRKVVLRITWRDVP